MITYNLKELELRDVSGRLEVVRHIENYEQLICFWKEDGNVEFCGDCCLDVDWNDFWWLLKLGGYEWERKTYYGSGKNMLME